MIGNFEIFLFNYKRIIKVILTDKRNFVNLEVGINRPIQSKSIP